MPDSSAVDAALLARLATDDELRTLMPDGVYFDVAAPGSTRYVIVALLVHEDAYPFGGSAWERFTYLVKAVEQAMTGEHVKPAAARIHALLQDAILEPDGYACLNLQRRERIRLTEPDDISDARWQHRGGHYEVMVQPVEPTP